MLCAGNVGKPSPEDIEAAGIGWVIAKPLTSGELEGLLTEALSWGATNTRSKQK
jgi:hypothetical protein